MQENDSYRWMIDAARHWEYGLVNYVVEQRHLNGTLYEICSLRIFGINSPVGHCYAIKAVNAGFNNSVLMGQSAKIEAFGSCFGTSDFKEVLRPFLEKKKSQFSRKA